MEGTGEAKPSRLLYCTCYMDGEPKRVEYDEVQFSRDKLLEWIKGKAMFGGEMWIHIEEDEDRGIAKTLNDIYGVLAASDKAPASVDKGLRQNWDWSQRGWSFDPNTLKVWRSATQEDTLAAFSLAFVQARTPEQDWSRLTRNRWPGATEVTSPSGMAIGSLGRVPPQLNVPGELSSSDQWLLTVDRLWLVTFNHRLVVTSCPAGRRNINSTRPYLVDRVIQNLYNRAEASYLWVRIVMECAKVPTGFIDHAQSIIDTTSAERADSHRVVYHMIEDLPSHRSKEYDGKIREISSELVRIHRELKCLSRLGNVINDLDTCKRAVPEQLRCLRGLIKDIGKLPGYNDELIQDLINIRPLAEQAEYTTAALLGHAVDVRLLINELFNFKQSFSTVLGAQFQLRQLDASNRSGNIIMYFTMMTILFSSLSLVTAFMALNVRTFPHDEGGSVEWGFTFASSRIVAYSIAIAAPFWVLALFLNPMGDVYNMVKDFFSKKPGQNHEQLGDKVGGKSNV